MWWAWYGKNGVLDRKSDWITIDVLLKKKKEISDAMANLRIAFKTRFALVAKTGYSHNDNPAHIFRLCDVTWNGTIVNREFRRASTCVFYIVCHTIKINFQPQCSYDTS